MKPLIVLLLAFSIAVFATKLIFKQYNFTLSAQIAMCAMLCFTAIGHFAFAKGMSMMIPSFIPFKTEIVFTTGIIEIVLGVGLLVPRLRMYSAWMLILLFVILLPANINAAIKNIDYQKATFDGNGPSYLWFRVPLQILFIAWTYLSSIRI